LRLRRLRHYPKNPTRCPLSAWQWPNQDRRESLPLYRLYARAGRVWQMDGCVRTTNCGHATMTSRLVRRAQRPSGVRTPAQVSRTCW
jgi:hypothetical protein